tara:strand:- start:5530 stop:8625 length:3096 start_codon:yes stop_codon:yes gene_type:complete
MSQEKVRETLIKRLEEDLIGPVEGADEIFARGGGPNLNYFSAKLYPLDLDFTEDENEESHSQFGGKDTEHCLLEDTAKKFKKTSSMGLTFLIEKSNADIEVKVEFGLYKKFMVQNPKKKGKEIPNWKRKQFKATENITINKDSGNFSGKIKTNIFDDLVKEYPEQFTSLEYVPELHLKTRKINESKLSISLFLVNRSREKNAVLFQTKLSVESKKISFLEIADKKNNFYIQDNPKNYSIGHTASTEEYKNKKGEIEKISTTWMPRYFHSDVDPDGHESLKKINFFAADFVKGSDKEILNKLTELKTSYELWLKNEFVKLSNDLTEARKKRHAEIKEIIDRFSSSIKFIENDKNALNAFRYANETIMLSSRFNNPDVKFKWRPFQIGFFLLSVESILDKKSKNRNIVDLLWFPTGGGKTEAYLLLSATLIFYRKFKKGGLEEKDSLAMFTRYTLRALTVDQFNRLATMIVCAEIIRKRALKQDRNSVAKNPFSIGLWVGDEAIPNYVSSTTGRNADTKWTNIFTKCPCCGKKLKWRCIDSKDWKLEHQDQIDACEVYESLDSLPIRVIDELIYAQPPSVLIGTIDKFVQIFRKPKDVKKLFATDLDLDPPDLIIQDELHLISGPLGSLTGAIEYLIEDYAENPKIITSTATIQKADEQILSLYGKKSCLFPLNLANPNDSFFSVKKQNSTGREYIGLTSATANSGNYLLQSVSAILLQSLKDKGLSSLQEFIDPYSTPVFYFNSLRELGAADVLLRDDAIASISAYAKSRNEEEREQLDFEELSSNASGEEITDIRMRLENKYNEKDHISGLLSTVMISVGLDVSRLGLMVIVGQPKSISEYIQASSRVGRGEIPGIVITLFNEYKPRDKSYFESFNAWNKDMYSHVETSSVTPFAARAREKIFPALLVGFTLKELNMYEASDFGLTDKNVEFIKKNIIPKILKRIEIIDNVRDEAEEELEKILNTWKKRGRIPHLWKDSHENESLLISSEAALVSSIDRAEGGGHAFAAPNSARSVEPGVNIRGKKILHDL